LTIQDYEGKQVPEIGYLLKKAYWHNGYATELAIGCKSYAFEQLNLNEVYSIIRDTNLASQRVAQRNAMTKIDVLTKHYYNIDMPHFVYCVKRA
jgi:ribosomal-protein-alanine N-acetyltransferase